MKAVPKIELSATPIDPDATVDHLQEILKSTRPEVKSWLLAQIEAALAQVPFLQASLRDVHAPEKPAPDRLLTAQEAGAILGVTKKWLYRNSKRLPFTRRLSRKVLRFSQEGLRRWKEHQKP